MGTSHRLRRNGRTYKVRKKCAQENEYTAHINVIFLNQDQAQIWTF